MPLQLVEKKEEEETDNKNTNKKSLKGMSDTADRSIQIKEKINSKTKSARHGREKHECIRSPNIKSYKKKLKKKSVKGMCDGAAE